MAAGVSFGVTTRISGGGILLEVADRIARDNLDYHLLARLFVQRFPLSEFRFRLPRRTGALRNSIYLRQVGTRVELIGLWYAYFNIDIERVFAEMARATVEEILRTRNIIGV